MTQQAQMKRIEELFGLGSHLGHKKSRVHPRARKFIYKMVNGTSVIDLSQTVIQIEEVKKILTELARAQKTMLVVGTKKVASTFIKDFCTAHNIPFISAKWMPGLLTNFETLMKNVQKLNEMIEKEKTGELEDLVKHERIKLQKEKQHLLKLYGGLLNLKSRPDVVFVVDARKEKNAVNEARAFEIPVIALMDTNSNPDLVSHVVMANDDATEVVTEIMRELLEVYVAGKSTPAAE